MVNILYINGNIMKRGGIEAFMMNYFREFDRSQIHIDFIVHGYDKGVYDDEILAAGSRIYHVPTKSKHPIKYVKELRKIFKNQKYDIVHSHLDAMSGWVLKIAKECGIPIRIAHSHNTDHLTTNFIKYKINEASRKKVSKYATHCFACSVEAGRWLFGERKFIVIPNAVSTERFKFNEDSRKKIRKLLKVENDEILIGNVGRFDTQKNQKFLVEVFDKLYKLNEKYKLIFVGSGDMQQEVESYSNNLECRKNIIFVGSKENVYEYYNAMDIFTLPSIFEGLGIVLIESQLNGLQSFASDVVPREVSISDHILFLPLVIEEWTQAIEKCSIERKDNLINWEKYDIHKAAIQLQKIYIDLQNGREVI